MENNFAQAAINTDARIHQTDNIALKDPSKNIEENCYIPADVFNLNALQNGVFDDIASISNLVSTKNVNPNDVATKMINRNLLTKFPQWKVDAEYLENTQAYRKILEFVNTTSKLPNLSKYFETKSNETNEILTDYQEQVDDLADDQNTEDLLNQILEEYAAAHGKSVDDLSQEEIIDAINQYIEDHVDYTEDVGNELGDLKDLIEQLLGGGTVNGDCEEIAILKAALLEAAGIDATLGFTGENGSIDHVVVIVNGNQILNTEGADPVDLDDIILRTGHDENGMPIVLNSEGEVNTENYSVDTRTGDDGDTETQGTGGAGGAGGPAGSNPPGPPPTGGDPWDLLIWLESALNWEIFENDEEDQFVDDAGNGYQEIKASLLERFAKRVIGYGNAISCIIGAMMMKWEMIRTTQESLTEIPIKIDDKLYKDAIEKFQRRVAMTVTSFVMISFQNVLSNNQEHYTEKMEAWQKELEGMSWWDGMWDAFTGDSGDIMRDMKRETERFESVTNNIKQQMRGVMSTIAAGLGTTGGMDIDQIAYQGIQNAIDDMWGTVTDVSGGKMSIDMNALTSKYRAMVVAMQNARRMYYDLTLFSEDLRGTTREELVGIKGSKADAKSITAALENENAHILTFFDQTMSIMSLEVNLHNQAKDIEIEIDRYEASRAGNICKVLFSLIACVAALVAACLPGGAAFATAVIALVIVALLATIAAIISGFAAAAESANIENCYDPVVSEPTMRTSSQSTGDRTLDIMQDIEREQNSMLLNMIRNNSSLFSSTSDGYSQLNYHQLAQYLQSFTGMSNAIRALCDMASFKEQLRNITKAEISGITLDSSRSQLLKAAVEANLQQAGVVFSGVKFTLNEMLTSKNLNIQNDKLWDAAITTLVSSIVGGVCGLALSAIPGVGYILGVTIGLAVGQAVGGVINAYYNSDINSGYSMPGDNQLSGNTTVVSSESTAEARLDALENNIFANMLTNGTMGTGDGFEGVNFGLAVECMDQLGKIAMAKEALASARSFGQELRMSTRSALTGRMGETSSSLTKDVNNANFSASVETMQLITSYLQQKVDAHNRNRTAEKQQTQAWTTFGITVACSAAATIGAGVASLAGAAESVSAAIASISMGVSGISNIVAQMAFAGETMNADLGAYENYDPADDVTTSNRGTVAEGEDINNILADYQSQIMSQMSRSMISKIGTAAYGVSPSSNMLTEKLTKLAFVKEALADAQSMMSELRQQTRMITGGYATIEGGNYRGAVNIEKTISLKKLENMRSALEVIAQRQTEKAQAAQQLPMLGISLGLQCVMFGLSVAKSVDGIKAEAAATEAANKEVVRADGTKTTAKQLEGELQAQKAEISARMEARKAVIAAETDTDKKAGLMAQQDQDAALLGGLNDQLANFQGLTYDRQSDSMALKDTGPDGRLSTNTSQSEFSEKSIAQLKQLSADLKDEAAKLAAVEGAVQIMQTVMRMIMTQVILDKDAQFSGSASSTTYRPSSGSSEAQAENAESQDHGNFMAGTTEMEAQIFQNQMNIAQYMLEQRKHQMRSQKNEQMKEDALSLIKQSCDLTGTLVKVGMMKDPNFNKTMIENLFAEEKPGQPAPPSDSEAAIQPEGPGGVGATGSANPADPTAPARPESVDPSQLSDMQAEIDAMSLEVNGTIVNGVQVGGFQQQITELRAKLTRLGATSEAFGTQLESLSKQVGMLSAAPSSIDIKSMREAFEKFKLLAEQNPSLSANVAEIQEQAEGLSTRAMAVQGRIGQLTDKRDRIVAMLDDEITSVANRSGVSLARTDLSSNASISRLQGSIEQRLTTLRDEISRGAAAGKPTGQQEAESQLLLGLQSALGGRMEINSEIKGFSDSSHQLNGSVSRQSGSLQQFKQRVTFVAKGIESMQNTLQHDLVDDLGHMTGLYSANKVVVATAKDKQEAAKLERALDEIASRDSSQPVQELIQRARAAVQETYERSFAEGERQAVEEAPNLAQANPAEPVQSAAAPIVADGGSVRPGSLGPIGMLMQMITGHTGEVAASELTPIKEPDHPITDVSQQMVLTKEIQQDVNSIVTSGERFTPETREIVSTMADIFRERSTPLTQSEIQFIERSMPTVVKEHPNLQTKAEAVLDKTRRLTEVMNPQAATMVPLTAPIPVAPEVPQSSVPVATSSYIPPTVQAEAEDVVAPEKSEGQALYTQTLSDTEAARGVKKVQLPVTVEDLGKVDGREGQLDTSVVSPNQIRSELKELVREMQTTLGSVSEDSEEATALKQSVEQLMAAMKSGRPVDQALAQRVAEQFKAFEQRHPETAEKLTSLRTKVADVIAKFKASLTAHKQLITNSNQNIKTTISGNIKALDVSSVVDYGKAGVQPVTPEMIAGTDLNNNAKVGKLLESVDAERAHLEGLLKDTAFVAGLSDENKTILMARVNQLEVLSEQLNQRMQLNNEMKTLSQLQPEVTQTAARIKAADQQILVATNSQAFIQENLSSITSGVAVAAASAGETNTSQDRTKRVSSTIKFDQQAEESIMRGISEKNGGGGRRFAQV